MTSVLLTAFEPYEGWASNASWLCLQELTRDLPREPAITTRLYPVQFDAARERLMRDLEANYDFALHLGQAPGATRIRLEAMAINVRGEPCAIAQEFPALAEDGPAAFRTSLPLASWAATLIGAGIPTSVSYHAGTFLCNATLYWSHYLAERMSLRTRSAFMHVPLDTSQTLLDAQDRPSMNAAVTAAGLRLILGELTSIA